MMNEQTNTRQLKTGILRQLKIDSPTMCRHWFEDMRVVDVVDGSVRILIDEPVQLKYLRRCCTQQFVEAAQSVTGRLLGVRFVGGEELEKENTSVIVSGDVARGAGGEGLANPDDDMLISPDYSFDNFVIVFLHFLIFRISSSE